jgi:hypothetical protein
VQLLLDSWPFELLLALHLSSCPRLETSKNWPCFLPRPIVDGKAGTTSRISQTRPHSTHLIAFAAVVMALGLSTCFTTSAPVVGPFLMASHPTFIFWTLANQRCSYRWGGTSGVYVNREASSAGCKGVHIWLINKR